MKIAFKMKLKPGMIDEYISRHKNVFPALEMEFLKAGVSDYTIWFDEDTNYLFAYVALENKKVWDCIEKTQACKSWWEFMEPLMETNEDHSPISIQLKQAYEFKIKT